MRNLAKLAATYVGICGLLLCFWQASAQVSGPNSGVSTNCGVEGVDPATGNCNNDTSGNSVSTNSSQFNPSTTLYYNFTGANLPNLATALAGGGGAILFAGDSTTMGFGVTSNPALGYPYQVYSDMLTASLPVVFNATTGAKATNGTNTDARVVLTGTAQLGTAITGFSNGFSFSSAAAGQIAFTPTVNVDTFDIYYIQGGVSGTATVNINGGGTLGTISTSGSTACVKLHVTATLGSNTVNIVWASGGFHFIQAIDAYNSASTAVRVIGAGEPGSTSNTWVSGGGAADCIAAIAPKLTVFNIGINDWQGAQSLSNYTSNVTSTVTVAQVSGDVILVGPNSTQPPVPEATQLTFISALQAIANTKNVPMINLRATLGTYATANANGNMYDNLHPDAAGYAIIGTTIASKL